MTMIAALAVSSFLTLQASLPVKTLSQHQEEKGKWLVKTACPEIQSKLPLASAFNSAVASFTQQASASFIKEAKSDIAEFIKQYKSNPTGPYELDTVGTVTFASERLISGVIESYRYTGGAHGMTNYQTFNFALVGGKAKMLTLSDLFRKGVDYYWLTNGIVISKLMKNSNAVWIDEGTLTSFTRDQLEKFTISSKGISFIFEPYVVGPYAVGTVTVPVPFSEFEGKLDADGPLKGIMGAI